MGTLFQAVEIIFEVQRKRIKEKMTREKNKLSNLQNMFFFFFGPFPLSNLITFLSLIYFKQLKVL
jgi:hypothetical protein